MPEIEGENNGEDEQNNDLYPDEWAATAIDVVKPFGLTAFGALFGSLAPQHYTEWTGSQVAVSVAFVVGLTVIFLTESRIDERD